jgi:acetyl-CoA carboxylase carboxyltransferase component
MTSAPPPDPEPDTEPDLVGELRERRDRIRGEMGGAGRIERLHARGERTIREHLDALLDAGSFDEVGTFVRSLRTEDHDDTPGDGKIGGHGTIDGRAVTVAGDDITVKRGSSSPMGSRRLGRLFAHAEQCGHPIVYFGATGGARIPDSLGSAGFAQVAVDVNLFRRRRRVPFITVIIGDSFGGSSFVSAASDLVIQVRGTCLAVTSPLVAKIATGEVLTNDELGGVDVHARTTGQIDLVAEDDDEAYAMVRRALALLPSGAAQRAPRAGPAQRGAVEPDPALAEIVPRRRARAYDVHKVLARVLDEGSLLELGAGFGRGLVCGLGRLDGHTVGVVASQPKFFAGALDPAACEKAVKLLCLCDPFDIPVLFFQDVPGFFVGKQVEHDGMLKHAIRLQTALALSEAPKLTVLLRKAYGLAYFSLGGNDTGVDAVYAWPSAEISFMDPLVAANVVAGGDEAQRDALAGAMRADIDPYGAAGLMKVDEIIDPADTRPTLARALARLEGRPAVDGAARPLASWPTC